MNGREKTIAEALGLYKGAREVTAVIGSGGKTTLLWTLAGTFRGERTLVGTSVKIWRPEKALFDRFAGPREAAALREPKPGITLAGRELAEKGKIGSLPLELLGELFARFDKSFIEADGSHGLPFKGWAEYEPVVPRFVTLTVAVMPVPPAGSAATADWAHRLPLFCGIAGAKAGEALLPAHLAAAVAHPKGLLRRARGRTALFFNQVETPEAESLARKILFLLPAACRERLWAVLAGSARHNRGLVLWRNRDL